MDSLMRFAGFVLVLVIVITSGCQNDDDQLFTDSLDRELEQLLISKSGENGLDFYRLPASNDYTVIPQDPKNSLTDKKVELGKLLYHETALGIMPVQDIGQQTYSCASCHFASAGFQAGRFQSVGEGGIGFGVNGEGRNPHTLYDGEDLDVQPVRSPSAMNIAYQDVILWNGQFGSSGLNEGTEAAWTPGTPKEVNNLGYEGTEIQAIAGLTVHRMGTDSIIQDIPEYKAMYDEVFADVPADERYNLEHTGLAIAAYERTILSNKAPFQEWLNGNISAMSQAEKRGAILFFGKAKCNTCHTGPALNSMTFHALGMGDLDDCPEEVFKTDPADAVHLGRGGFTGRQEDMYAFKTPQLYNLSDSPFYGHGATFRNLRDVIEYKNKAIPQNPDVPGNHLSPLFKPLNLTDQEIDDIVMFLSNSLRDPDLKRYEPNVLPSGLCFPNNDPISRQELGCE